MRAGVCGGSTPFLPGLCGAPAPPAQPPYRFASLQLGVRGDWPGQWVSLWGGARRAGPGQVHTAALCSGVGRLGAARGFRLVALETWRAPECKGRRPSWPPLQSPPRPGPPGAESATPAAVLQRGGGAEKGILPALGLWGGAPTLARRETGRGVCGSRRSCREQLAPGSCLLLPSSTEGAGLVGGRGEFPTVPRPFSAVPQVAAVAGAGPCRRYLRLKCLGGLGGGLESFWGASVGLGIWGE